MQCCCVPISCRPTTSSTAQSPPATGAWAAPAAPAAPTPRAPSPAPALEGAALLAPATQPFTAAPTAAAPKRQSAYSLGTLTPNQFTDGKGFTDAEKSSTCGPAAITAFLRFLGHDVSFEEVVKRAPKHGWNTSEGMSTGSKGMVSLAESYGLKVSDEWGVDWDKVRETVQRGVPVIINSPGHYYVAERYDPATGRFDFGNSAKAMKASGGETWWRPEDLPKLGMGAGRAALFLETTV